VSDKELSKTIYISIGSSIERSITLTVLNEMRLTILDAAETPDDPLEFFNKGPFAFIMDGESCRQHEDFIQAWFENSHDHTPLLFWGRWEPAFYHRSLLDISGVTSVDLKAMLEFIQRCRHSDLNKPFIFYPYTGFDSDYFALLGLYH